MSAAGAQTNRFELKYLIDERTAGEVRRYVRQFLEPDEHTDPRGGIGYPVHSLYLDSYDLVLARQTLSGKKNRFKLRIRFYDDEPDSPVFLEIKRRVNDVIMKERAIVYRTSVPNLLAGIPLDHPDLVKDDAKNYKALLRFCELRNELGAKPAAFTSYEREAYEPPDSNQYRVTFDRKLLAGSFRGGLSVADLRRWARPEIEGVVLELKFNGRFPDWMGELVRLFNLQRISMPKYVECVTVIDGSPLRHFGRRAAWPSVLPMAQ
jgi:SPX domain protein involved in polyphosphate accumulation